MEANRFRLAVILLDGSRKVLIGSTQVGRKKLCNNSVQVRQRRQVEMGSD